MKPVDRRIGLDQLDVARDGDAAGCVDLFSKFLQTYPASEYAELALQGKLIASSTFKNTNVFTLVALLDETTSTQTHT